MQNIEIKLENDLGNNQFEVSQITNEFIIKDENDQFIDTSAAETVPDRIYRECDTEKNNANASFIRDPEVSYKLNTCIHCNTTFESKINLDDHIIKNHLEFISSISSNVHQCTHCTYITTLETSLAEHMLQHPAAEYSNERIVCIYCSATFSSKLCLDDHILKKHPESIASVSSKIHECTNCTYKTTLRENLRQHMLKHFDAKRIYKTGVVCIHCNATYSRKIYLDDHILKKHPESKASVSGKIHECTNCTYKTTLREHWRQHVLKHIDAKRIYKTGFVCIHCNATFTTKVRLDDHILMKHPEFKSSISSEIYECAHCTYKTTLKHSLVKHMSNHSGAKGSINSSVCIHCNAIFTRKICLDGHILRKHPEFITSVSSKIHECAYCTYKTNLTNPMLNYTGAEGSCKFSVCIHCNATFMRKVHLDDHILKKHPEHISPSIAKKIRECTDCTYKTTIKHNFTRHILQHSGAKTVYKNSVCIHCNATYSRKLGLDDHILRKHPEFAASVSSKIHGCANCTYKTTSKDNFRKHMLKHSSAKIYKSSVVCIHCNARFKRKSRLNDHILVKHPDFTISITSKIYKCAHCTYKTTLKYSLVKHMLNHPGATGSINFNVCIHCNATFTRKMCVDDHILRKHPEFISSVSSKIHECTSCTYKTTSKDNLRKHLLKHSAAKKVSKSRCCVYSL
ncbi:unnamed protein product [Acanthoscelides obtectus]|nr:unnamed protein product [Acanthoscelides obtectus]CAK1664863.1 Zinc finger protein 142 [Acanthoscelides obtectus]